MKYLIIIFAALFLISCDVSTSKIEEGGSDSVNIDSSGENAGNPDPDDNIPVPPVPDDNASVPPVPDDSELVGDAVVGKALYESAEQGCLTCHSVDGQSPYPIDLNAETYSRDSEEHTLAAYIERYMPVPTTTKCDLACATDIAAYLRSIAEEAVEVILPSELESVVTRLTNNEYYSVLSELVELSDERQATLRETVELSAELEHGGLVSAAERQQLNQITFGGFLAAATEAANLRLLGGGVNVLTLDRFNAFILCSNTSMSHNDCIRDRGISYIEKGFRGQATDSDIVALDELLAAFDSLTLDTEELERLVLRYQAVVQFVALSPKFATIYETGIAADESNSARPLTEVEIANRLAFFITGTQPDAALLSAAAAGLLQASAERREQAVRLATDEASSAGVEKIVASWLGVDADLTNADAIAETQAFVKGWIQEGRPFSDLYTSTVAVNNTPVDGQTTNVSYEPFGALGLQAVVESNTNPPVASFINRGEFIVAELLCGLLPTDLPDAAVEGDAENALEVFTVHNQEPCATCHKIFDNYGAALQRFDGTTSLYNPGDDWLGTSFELTPIGDVSGTVSTVAELGKVLGASRQAHTCFANLWYRHAMRRDLLTTDTNEDEAVIDEIVDEWMQGDSSVKTLLELISGHEVFSTLYR